MRCKHTLLQQPWVYNGLQGVADPALPLSGSSLRVAAKFGFRLPCGMETHRLEAFSDGVLAIIITIMVLELKIPHDPSIGALKPLLPVFLTYILSFIYLGIYWNNHHHLLKACGSINGAIMWANLHLLFWLSLFPFVTGWMGENHFKPVPSAFYGAILFMAAISYYILQNLIVSSQGRDSQLARAIGFDVKGKLSLLFYIAGVILSCFQPGIAGCLYLLVALIWFIPDRRLERFLQESGGATG